MPYLAIQTNCAVESTRQTQLLQLFSSNVATWLGKPESYVMVALRCNTPMLFAGTDEPTACIQLKSLGLQASQTAELSQRLCQQVEQELGIPQGRIYIEFVSPARPMWGWNGGTF